MSGRKESAVALDASEGAPSTTALAVTNPATEEVIATVPETSAEETERAIARAGAAAVGWARLSPADRGRLLHSFAAEVDSFREELALLEVAEAGHPIGAARWEAGNVRDVLAYYAAAPERLAGRQIPVAGGLDVTFHEPLGVVGVIVPWNFPMPIASWGLAPALAAGNAVVLKPAEQTPLTALRLASLALAAGLPEGLLQVLPGRGPVTGDALVRHPSVRKICFTGSVAVGKSIMAACSGDVKRVTLELGGKSANIVFNDADLEAAASSAPMAAFDNAGQDCCARSRILVQRPVYERFMELLSAAVSSVVVGSPLDESTQMGPLISAAQLSRVTGYVPSSITFRGRCPSGPGFWFPPTVLAGPSVRDLPAWREEVFGPVVCVTPFSDEAEAVALANDTSYGLSGSIWTRDVGRAIRVSRAVESGNLSVNSHSSVRYATPFGGFKTSGLGRELGPDAPLSFTETKNVFIATG
jgi:acyl-CoA reductase-like NAD-dependent aldehyde dehydrogenase